MKTIGLIGGMSWESTVTYYQTINRVIREQRGGLHSAKCLIYSVDFHDIEECQSKGNWAESARILSGAAQSLEQAGADFIVICTNTMHKVAEEIAEAISIPILHIADATAQILAAQSINQVALLGTQYTMEQDFYKRPLRQRGIHVTIPGEKERAFINHAIFHELCLGVISEETKKHFLAIINSLAAEGVQGVILGCTEIGLLVSQSDTNIPLFDTALIHAKAAAKLSLRFLPDCKKHD